jgi:hypothetical protein
VNATSLGDTLLTLAAPRAFREEILGDVHEKFREHEAYAGKHAAIREFYVNVCMSLPALMTMKIKAHVRIGRVRSFLFGFAAFLAVFTADQTAGVLGIYSQAFWYSLIVIVTYDTTRVREAISAHLTLQKLRA